MSSNKVVIITGEKGEGKTTKILEIVDLLKGKSISIIGFAAVGEWRNSKRSKFTMVDITSGNLAIICTDTPTNGYDKRGRFYFNPLAVKFGEEILYSGRSTKTVVVIDEIGPFELDGEVWHNLLVHHLQNTENVLLLSVRKKLVNEVIEKFHLFDVSVYETHANNNDIAKEIAQNVI